MEKLTQEERVLRHIKEFGSITSFEAFVEYGITRLSAVIYNLIHKKGYDIASQLTKGKNRYDEDTYFSTYTLEKDTIKIKNDEFDYWVEINGHDVYSFGDLPTTIAELEITTKSELDDFVYGLIETMKDEILDETLEYISKLNRNILFRLTDSKFKQIRQNLTKKLLKDCNIK